MVTQAHKRFYQENGYVVVEGLFDQDEVARYREHFMTLRRHGAYPGDLVGADPGSNDPLKRYPRMIHMHRWDDVSLNWMIDERINASLTGLLGREPYAVQTMLYFKPPGARGQALHQDNFYLKAQPGTCIAAWMALDDCDEANGCMQIVPGSHTWPLLCTTKADTSVSFTDVTVPLPAGQEVRPVLMKAGDVLFFNGALVHGSFPNISTDRFRRALIGHYIEGAAEQVAQFYHPALRMDGRPLELAVSRGGGECGVWVERDGQPTVELVGQETVSRKHE
ncbi:MAG TPA: phytanoyl-CoA dioxygenase family protein [Roseiflexaceae bacterium]|nr:phytanoyl-CoA dioxygenase family protein [Roseiflexaceae bacterium]